jgi:hypothetical protein
MKLVKLNALIYRKYIALSLTVFLMACNATKQSAKTIGMNNQFLDSLFKTDASMQAFIVEKDSLNIQVIYTKIDRDKNNAPTFTSYDFNVNPARYFYPGSTVKMPVAFLALEKLRDLKKFQIDRNTVTNTQPSINGQAPFYTFDSVGSIAKYVEEIFLVSDNEAFNRLYEFVGPEYIQQKLQEKGYNQVAIRHRLSVALTDAQNRQTNAIKFIDANGKVLFSQPEQLSKVTYQEPEIKLGKGYYSDGRLVDAPFNFTYKNRLQLADLNKMLQTLLFPEVNKPARFTIDEIDRKFLLRSMSAFPREGLVHKYSAQENPDRDVKFLMEGLATTPAYNHIRCFNKSGLAYGYLTDVAYFVDFENNVEFMLSATILSNKDQVFNDDKYDFETIGYPFMKLLSKAVYDHELKRPKQFIPNLDEFKIDY